MIPKKSYKELCEENKKLFEQAEECTLMMGFWMLKGHHANRQQYQNQKKELLKMADRNLDLIEEIWNEDIIVAENKKPDAIIAKVILLHKNYYGWAYIASQTFLTQTEVKEIIKKYKAGELLPKAS